MNPACLRPHALALALLAAPLLLSACASSGGDRVTKAATTPLSDLNLVNAPIPDVLKAAKKTPYALAADATCALLADDVRALDEVLGPDLDAPPAKDDPGLIERGGDFAGSALQKTAEGIVPFRGWVRKLSGAERYSKQVSAAIAAGGIRRAFLKGVSTARACPAAT